MTKTPGGACWSCGHPFELASDLTGQHRPSPGDISLCIKCGAIGTFTETLTVREPSDAERQAALRIPAVIDQIMAIRLVQERHQHGYGSSTYEPVGEP